MRTHLPHRRPSEVLTFEHGGTRFTGSFSWSRDGQPLEIFLDGGKPGSAIASVAKDSAVAASLALQYGVPLATLRAAMTRNDDGKAGGPLGAMLDLVGEQ